MSIININKLKKYYGNKLAIDNLSLTICEGDVYGLIGPNGAGKSTLISIISGLLDYNSGECELFNLSIKTSKKFIQKKIGLVTQENTIYEDLKAKENLEFFARLYGIDPKDIKAKIDTALKYVDLLEYKNSFPSSFSGGMKRRLNIACSIIHNPDILIMDEPTSSLDPISRQGIKKIIYDLKKSGKTILYTSHNLTEVEDICDKVSIINNGKVIFTGNTNEIKNMVESNNTLILKIKSFKTLDDRIISNIRQVIFRDFTLLNINSCNGINDYIIKASGEDINRLLIRLIPYLKEQDIFIEDINIEKSTLENIFFERINQ